MLRVLFDNQNLQNWLESNGLGALYSVMWEIEFRAFISVVVSFLLVLGFGKRTVRWLVRKKIGDAPEFYNKDVNELMKDKANTPTMGGLLIGGAILTTILLFADVRNFYVILGIVVFVWLALLGGVDDWLKLTASRRLGGTREGLRMWEKLVFQLAIGVIAAVFLYMHGETVETRVLTLPFQRTYVPDSNFVLESGVIVLPFVVFVPLVLLLIAGTSNAVNLTDGMDGLAAGTLIVASFAMMSLCYIAGDEAAAQYLYMPFIGPAEELMVMTGAMAGACLGFLWFNCFPAQVFMGDTGSLPLGGFLAYVAAAVRQELLFIIIGGVWFMEMASVMLQIAYFKRTGGKRIFRMAPIHHHFQLKGWSEQQVVTRFWVLAVVLAMIALVTIKMR